MTLFEICGTLKSKKGRRKRKPSGDEAHARHENIDLVTQQTAENTARNARQVAEPLKPV